MQSAMNSSMVVLLPLFLGVSLSVALLGGWISLGRLPKKYYVLHRPISFLITDIYPGFPG